MSTKDFRNSKNVRSAGVAKDVTTRVLWFHNPLPAGNYQLRILNVSYTTLPRTGVIAAKISGRGKFSGMQISGTFDLPPGGKVGTLHVMSEKQKKQKLARDKRNAAKKAKKVVKKVVVAKRKVAKRPVREKVHLVVPIHPEQNPDDLTHDLT